MIQPTLQSFDINSFGWTVVVCCCWLGVVIGLVTHWSRDD